MSMNKISFTVRLSNKDGLHSIRRKKMIRCCSNELVEPRAIKVLIGVLQPENCAAKTIFVSFSKLYFSGSLTCISLAIQVLIGVESSGIFAPLVLSKVQNEVLTDQCWTALPSLYSQKINV